MINENTWRKLGKISLLNSRKVARCVLKRKLFVFFFFLSWVNSPATFLSWEKNQKSGCTCSKKTQNLFGTDGLALFDLWDLPTN